MANASESAAGRAKGKPPNVTFYLRRSARFSESTRSGNQVKSRRERQSDHGSQQQTQNQQPLVAWAVISPPNRNRTPQEKTGFKLVFWHVTAAKTFVGRGVKQKADL